MSNFVKGQKLIWVDYDGLDRKDVGRIVTFIKDDLDSLTENLIYIKEEINHYYSCRFKTIIQSIDDVIPGIEVTFKTTENIYKVSSVKNNKIYILYNSIEYNWGYSLDTFKEYRPKKGGNKIMDQKDYEVIKPFTILDIYKKRPYSCRDFNKEFEALLSEFSEEGWSVNHKFKNFKKESTWNSIKTSKVFMRNLSWLENKNFIKEKVKDVKLEPGMRVKTDSHTYIIDREQRYIHLKSGNILQESSMKTFSELKKNYPMENWEIINE